MPELYTPPPLARHVGSWAIIRTATGECVAELFRDSKAIRYLNAAKYHAIPIDQHLASLSKKGANHA